MHTAPTAAPIGLYVVSQSSSSVSLSWMPPQLERRNGIITGYSVNVTHSDSRESTLLSTTESSITIVQLSAFTTYLCSVAARTVVGLGPYTMQLTVSTDEDGKLIVN